MATGLLDHARDLDRRIAARAAALASGVLPSWAPYAGPQTTALATPADELFYGGAAGGGKTILGIGVALSRHRNSLILRRQSVDTKDIGEKLREFAAPGYRWKFSGHGGELRTADGRLIELGGCQHDDDWQKYAGRAHDYFYFDELSQFTEKQYTTLIAWNRVSNPVRYPDQRCRVIGGGNPPTNPEGEWVVKRWAPWLDPTAGDEAAPGELRWYAMIDGEEKEFASGDPVPYGDGKVARPKSRTFIPARVEDNPGLMAQGYDATLESLPEPLRSQLRFGLFGGAKTDHREQLIPSEWLTAAHRRWAANRDLPAGPLSCLGVDVAMSKGKGDATAVAHRHGRRVAALTVRPGSETPDGNSVRALIVACLNGSNAPVNLDAGNVGKSAYDACRNEPRMANVVPILFGGSTDYKDPAVKLLRFANERAAMYWNLRCLLDPEGPADTRLELPPDPELTNDLLATRWHMTNDLIYIELKEKIRLRLGRSPDKGDAVALACRAPRKALWAMTG